MHLRFTHTSILLAVCAFVAALSFLGFVLHAQAQSAINHNPIGALDEATCDVIAGWTCDADSFSTPLAVHLYKDGTYSTGTWLTNGTANGIRSDLQAVCGTNLAHAFTIPTPSELKDGREHTVSAYGINTGSAGSNTLLGSKTLTCSGTLSAWVPDAPAALAAFADSACGGRIKLIWTTVPGATSYEISYGGTTWVDVGNTITYTFTNFIPGESYTSFYVRAKSSGGVSRSTGPQATLASAACVATPSTSTGTNGVCGTAAKAYTTATAPLSGTFCSTRISPATNPVFLSGSSRVTWICPGENGGSDTACEATRSDFTNSPVSPGGTCGPYADVTVKGSAEGVVWGSGPYGGDRTDFGTAAVHAGLIQPGQTATIRRTLVGPSTLTSITRNGVTPIAYAQSMCAVDISLVGTATGGAQYACTGTLLSNATMYAGDETGLTSNTVRGYSVFNTEAKCEYSCNSGYHWNGTICAPLAETPNSACTGTMPANASAYDPDSSGPGGVVWNHSAINTDRKCEFYCHDGFDWIGGSCAIDPTAQCRGTLPQNAVPNPADADGIGGIAWRIQPNDTARKCEFTCKPGFNYNTVSGCVVPDRVSPPPGSDRWTNVFPHIELHAADVRPVGATTLSWEALNASTTKGCKLYVMELYSNLGVREVALVNKNSATAYPGGYPTIPIVVPTNYTLRCSTGTEPGDVWLYPRVRSYANMIPSTGRVAPGAAYSVVLDAEFANKCFYTQKRDGVVVKSDVQIVNGTDGWTEEILAKTSDNTPTRRRFTYGVPQGAQVSDGVNDEYEWSFSCTPTWNMGAPITQDPNHRWATVQEVVALPSSPTQVRMTVGQQTTPPTGALDAGLIPAGACTVRLSFSNMVSGFVDIIMSPWR